MPAGNGISFFYPELGPSMCVCVFVSVCESRGVWGAEHGGEHLTEAQASQQRVGNSWPFIDRF